MIHNSRTSRSGNHIFINKFTLRELNFALRAMDLRKSPSPDDIHGFMIAHLGPHGMQKLLDIFNFSWKIGRLLRDWKRAIIIPILKPGKDTSTSASNRPIALTTFVCKLMKRLVLSSGFDVGENELKLNRAMEEDHSFVEMHKLIFNASKSLATYFSTNRHIFNYQPKISMNGIQFCYVKNVKYFGYTLDQEITSNKHIEGQVIKARKRLNVLKLISGRDWGAESSTLRTTFIYLIIPVLEFVLRLYSLTRYFNKLYSYNEQHRTSAYLHTWINNRRLMKHSPFSYPRTVNLPSSDVEPYFLCFTGAVNQLALETINVIKQSSLKIYIDGSRGEKGISGSGVYIPTPSGALEFKIKNPNYCSVLRSELIAIRRGLQCAAHLEDRFQEIWILTDSRASIQHLANWDDIGHQTSLDILSLLHDLSSGHSIHFQWIPSHVGIEGNERAGIWLGLLLWRV
ncbi:putative RNA-directed DNA polymerase from transposon BS [Trichonephila clavipes]|nr:putative RNA-directed DNA polymerase from transposon BS [Trichonephila clavipes]